MKRFLGLILFFTAFFSNHPAFALQIDAVQHGRLIMDESSMEQTFRLDHPVDMERTFVTASVSSRNEKSDELSLKVIADFQDRGTLRITRRKAGTEIEVFWSVAEFKEGVRVRRGITDFPADVYQKRIAMTKMQTKRALVLLDFAAETCPLEQRAHLFFSYDFSDSQTLSIFRTDAVQEAVQSKEQEANEEEETQNPGKKKASERPRVSMPEATVGWQLIEFEDGVAVQQGTAKIPNFSRETSAYLAEPVKDMQKSFYFFSWTAGQDSANRYDLTQLRGELPEDSQLVFTRESETKERNADLRIQWNLVELAGSSDSVQRGLIHMRTGAKEQKVEMNPVFPGRALVLLSVSGGEGQGLVSDKLLSAALNFSAELGPDGQLTIRRGGAALEADVSWTVVEFSPITLQAPHGGEVFRIGDRVELSWAYSREIETNKRKPEMGFHADIQVSLNGGRDDFPYVIAEQIPVDAGQYAWVIPDFLDEKSVISKEVVLRILISGLKAKNFDQTRGNLEIKGLLSLVSPLGGERWYVGDTDRKIEWSYKGKIGILSIYYDRESGYGFNPFPQSQRIARVVPGSGGKGEFDWNPIPDITLSRGRIKIVSESDESVYSISDKDFVIVPRIDIELTAKEKSSYHVGDSLSLNWKTSGTVDFFNFYYQTDMYSDWKLGGEKIQGGPAGEYQFRWTIPPGAESDTLRLKVTKTTDTSVFDLAPDDLGGYIAVHSWLKLSDPTAHDIPVWHPHEKHVIEWDYGGSFEYLNFEYSADGGESWIKEAVVKARDRKYEWFIPEVNSTNVLISLTPVGQPSLKSSSNDYFEIRAFPDEIDANRG